MHHLANLSIYSSPTKTISIIQIPIDAGQTFAAKNRTNFWSGLKSNKEYVIQHLAVSVANVGLTSITKPMMSVSNPMVAACFL